MTPSIFNIFSDTPIVRKLRTVFFIILLIILSSFIIGAYQLEKLITAKNHTIQYSVPALVHSQRLATLLVKLSELSARLATEYSHEMSQTLGYQLSKISTEINQTAQTIDTISGEQYIGMSELKNKLIVLDKTQMDLVKYKSLLLNNERTINTNMDHLSQLRQTFETIMEPYLLNAISNYEKTLSNLSLSIDSQAVSDKDWQSLKAHGQTQSQLSEFSFRITNLIEKIESASSYRDTSKLADMVGIIKFESQGITQLLINLREQEIKGKLAALIKEVRTLSLGDEGILVNTIARAENSSHFQSRLSSQISLMTRITNVINTNVIAMETNTLNSAGIFDDTVRNTIITFFILGVMILGLTVLVLHYVIEVQLNRRMIKLTSAVNKIAGGDINHVVNISGHDEIGKMAVALEVFKDNARELRRSNKELEQFAYAASHDLKSPLSSIKLLAEWIKEDSTDLPQESQENLDLLLKRVDRLSTLQSDLLEFAKAGQSKNEIKLLRLPALVTEMADLLDPENKFLISVSEPNALLVRTQLVPLRQILLNLVNNAIKHHDRSNGTVLIDVKYNASRLYFSVKDDGPGIDPKYHEEVFGLFKTLQSRDIVEGSGLGLSLVRKLVEQTGGTIEVESSHGERGTAFVFDWPATWQNSVSGRKAA